MVTAVLNFCLSKADLFIDMLFDLQEISLIPQICEWVKIYFRVTKVIIYPRLPPPECVGMYYITALNV